MRTLAYKLRVLAHDSKAATAIEYGLIVGLVVVVLIAAMMALGTTTSDMWNGVSSKVVSASQGQ